MQYEANPGLVWKIRKASFQKKDYPYDEAFSNVIFDFFHAKPDSNCTDVNDRICDDTHTCGQWDKPGGATSPAGYMIANQFSALNRAFSTVDRGIMDAYNVFQGTSSTLVTAFGSFLDVTKYLIEQDIMNLMFGFLGVGIWGRALNANDFLKDGARALISFGVDYNKNQPSVASHLDFNENVKNWASKVNILVSRLWAELIHGHHRSSKSTKGRIGKLLANFFLGKTQRL